MMTGDTWHHNENCPPTPGESENQIGFAPGVPPLAIFPTIVGSFPKISYFCWKMAEMMWSWWCTRWSQCAHRPRRWNKKCLPISSASEKNNDFPSAVSYKRFWPNIAKNGFFLLILGQIKPNKNLRNARGKMTIPKMTARWMCIIIGMIMRVDTDFDSGVSL